MMGLHRGDALIVVDVQNDFLPGGALAVHHGEEVVDPLNRYMHEFERRHLPIFATRDWHPPDHPSFRSVGGPWPPHCVVETQGADFPAGLKLPADAEIVSKGRHPHTEGYSAFEETNLQNRLRQKDCGRLFIGGLATDYCVQATATDALRMGFEVVILQDAVRAIEAHPGDEARALGDLVTLGAQLASFPEVVPAGGVAR